MVYYNVLFSPLCSGSSRNHVRYTATALNSYDLGFTQDTKLVSCFSSRRNTSIPSDGITRDDRMNTVRYPKASRNPFAGRRGVYKTLIPCISTDFTATPARSTRQVSQHEGSRSTGID